MEGICNVFSHLSFVKYAKYMQYKKRHENLQYLITSIQYKIRDSLEKILLILGSIIIGRC